MDHVHDLLPIGRFARLSGLTVGALRHYDELDLLRPARTDPFTNYRLYRRDQLESARISKATSRRSPSARPTLGLRRKPRSEAARPCPT